MNGSIMNISRLIAIIALCIVATCAAHSQASPNKPVRYIVPYAPAGAYDVLARIVASKLSGIWGQQVIVDNRPGAEGNIGTDIVAKSPPDGYTILMGGLPTHAINPALYKKLPYDHIKDFAAVSLVGTVPTVLVVHPSLPVKSVSEFIAYAKANPGKINYGGGGTALHLSMEMLRSMTGIDVVYVPYKGSGPAITDLLGGQISIMFDSIPAELSYIKSGRLRALGVGSAKRTPVLPDVPTLKESGLPFEATLWYAVFAPAGVPKPIIDKMNTDVVKTLTAEDVQRRFESMGVDATPSTPEQLAAFVKSETAKWAKAVKDSGATVQ
jgi:tripartite-type tricarboxylate transporter receptor subunit TctC